MRRLLLLAALVSCAPAQPEAETTFSVQDLLGGSDTLHARAILPVDFVFPQDHGSHPQFRSEWWYFTGNLTAADGEELGYQLTFFRSALTDSQTFAATGDSLSAWRTRQVWMAHFAVSNTDGSGFHAAERFSRGALGLAGAEPQRFNVWLDDWRATSMGGDGFPLRVAAADGDVAIDLVLSEGKPLVLQGDRGLSAKGPQPGNASYYYSFTRMPTTGSIRMGGTTYTVRGASWLDREWSTSALADSIAGWDWMALRFDDNTELMLYRLRRNDGTADAFSAAKYVLADGSTRTLGASDFVMTPVSSWSASGGVRYPARWHVSVPTLGIEIDVEPSFQPQELMLAVRYWEGMVRIDGTRNGSTLRGRGYLEMTGYADVPGARGAAIAGQRTSH